MRDGPLTRSRTSAGLALIQQRAAQPRVYNIIQHLEQYSVFDEYVLVLAASSGVYQLNR